MDNLEIYNKYRSVPKEALKDFDNGNFKGTDINTMWRVKCLTEQFGVVGFGWTIKVLKTWSENVNDEILAFAEIEMRIKMNGEWSEPFTATGGNKMCSYVKSKDYYKSSDEAYKMAITDAFGVACKYLGIGADIYWANDKSKYAETHDNEPNYDKKPINDTKKETTTTNTLTLEEAKNQTIDIKGKTYTLGEMTSLQLLYLRDKAGITDKAFLDKVSLVLIDKATTGKINENNNKE